MEQVVVESVQGYVLFINNIDRNIDAETLTDTLSDYGNIITLHYELSRRTGIPLGFALVKYGNLENARDALKGLHGKRLGSKVLQCDWCFKHSQLSTPTPTPLQEESSSSSLYISSSHKENKSNGEEDHSEDKRKRDDYQLTTVDNITTASEPPLKKVK